MEKLEALQKISVSRTCVESHVSVSAIMWAEHVSIADDNDSCLLSTLLTLQKRMEILGEENDEQRWPLPSISYDKAGEAALVVRLGRSSRVSICCTVSMLAL